MHPTALHSLAHATRLLAGLGQPHTLPGHILPMGAGSSHLTRLIPRDALTTLNFSFPVHASSSSPECAHHPGVRSGSATCTLQQMHLPQPQHHLTKDRGLQKRSIFMPLTYGASLCRGRRWCRSVLAHGRSASPGVRGAGAT